MPNVFRIQISDRAEAIDLFANSNTGVLFRNEFFEETITATGSSAGTSSAAAVITASASVVGNSIGQASSSAILIGNFESIGNSNGGSTAASILAALAMASGASNGGSIATGNPFYSIIIIGESAGISTALAIIESGQVTYEHIYVSSFISNSINAVSKIQNRKNVNSLITKNI